MGVAEKIKREKKYQAGLILTVLTLVYFLWFGTGTSSAKSKTFTYEEINDILLGNQEGSDIEKVEVEGLSLHTPFFESGLGYTEWTIDGDVLVNKNNYIRLTRELKNQAGVIFSKNTFTDPGFEINFRFNLHGKTKTNALKGDGMAMFITDQRLGLGTVFGAQDYFNGIGLFFDTYRNSRKGRVFPYITVMNGDGKTPYDKNNDGRANELGGCTARAIYNSKQGYVDARLIHTVEDGYLSLDYNHDGKWINCFSVKDVHIPRKRYLGFSAATGDLFENADVMDVTVSRLVHHGKPVKSFQEFVTDEEREAKEEREAEEGKRQATKYKGKRREPNHRSKLRNKLREKQRRLERRFTQNAEEEGFQFFGTIWWMLKKGMIMLFVLFVAYVAFTVYRVKRRTSKKKSTGLLD